MEERNIINNEYYEILTDEGFKDFEGILETPTEKLIEIILEDGSSIKSTIDHNIFFNKTEYKEAQDFRVNDLLYTKDGYKKILGIQKYNKECSVFDILNVETTHSFYCNDIKISNCIICDEFAFIEPHIAEEFFASTWPTISSGTKSKFFIISTPNGYNKFYDIWRKAELRLNTFVPIRVHWTEVPGRDAEWKEREINNTSKALFEREYECSFDTVSDDALIKSEKISELMAGVIDPLTQDDHLSVYENPLPNEKYLITVDTAKGVRKDYSAFSVIKISRDPHTVVAVYRNNEISPLVYPEVIKNVGINYNKADLLIENNEYGSQIASSLIYEYEYDNVIWTYISQSKQRINYGNDGASGSLPGVRTTQSIKKIGCSNLKALIENNKLKVYDFQTITELSRFVRKGDSFQAEEGTHDDITMTLVLYAWLTTQDYFKNIDQNVGEDIRSLYQEEINSNMMYFGFILDGSDRDNEFLDDEDAIDHRYGWSKVQEVDFEDLKDFFKL